jgi:flagellar biosynthesis/type III secretory pathway protein FliH
MTSWRLESVRSYREICELFPEPEFAEAAGVLEVINQTPEQNELYSSRQKFLLDEASRLDSTRRDALKEGREEGREEGLLKGRIELIQTLQRLLNIPESTVEELSGNDDARLIEISDELQRQLRIRG